MLELHSSRLIMLHHVCTKDKDINLSMFAVHLCCFQVAEDSVHAGEVGAEISTWLALLTP